MAFACRLLYATTFDSVAVPFVVSVHGVGRRAAGRNDAQRRQVELGVRGAIEHLFRVVTQRLHHGLAHRELGKRLELAAVRNRVAVFRDGQRALDDREVGFRHGRRFHERSARGRNVLHDIPRPRLSLALAYCVAHVAELTEARLRLKRLAELVRQVQRIEKPAE
jgi:hypothetical protein